MLRISEYIRDSLQGRPGRPFRGIILIWNLTRGCNLSCQHCYASAGSADPQELSTQQALDLIPHLRRAGVRTAILSGGEPMARRDLWQIAGAMRSQGIATSLSSNGLLITPHNLPRLKENFDYVGISLDGPAEMHDHFRGMTGAHERSLQALRLCQQAGMRVGLRFTLSQVTAPGLPYIMDLSRREGFPKLYVSHLVFSGRGGALGAVPRERHRQLSQLMVEQAFEWHSSGSGPDLVTGNNETDAVILLQEFTRRHPEQAHVLRQRLDVWGGNQAGVRMVNVDALGNVKPDPFYSHSLGNVLATPFGEIWAQSDLLLQLRQRPHTLKGECAPCPYLSICNGNSRPRSYAMHGDYFQSDPCCFVSALV